MGQLDGLQGLGEGADLVELDEDGIAAAKLDAPGEAFGVGDEEIVAYQLDPAAQLLREKLPALPVLLVQGVLDGEDGITVHKLLPVADEGLGGKAGPGFWEKIFALPAALPLAGGGVHSQHKVFSWFVAGFLYGFQDAGDGFLVAGEIRSEAALVADSGGEIS